MGSNLNFDFTDVYRILTKCSTIFEELKAYHVFQIEKKFLVYNKKCKQIPKSITSNREIKRTSTEPGKQKARK